MTSAISLLELNLRVKESVRNAFAAPIWVRAEVNELHENANGICYLELVEKGGDEHIVAKQKAMIWASVYRMLKPYFESVTQTTLQVGISVSVLCKVEFHELYGMSLVISDIDPAYTLGDLALRKQMIVEQLKSDGIFDMNREQRLSPTPQRVAVVSSATAAGYSDFVNQLSTNKYGYAFAVQLFPAVMQGAQVTQSVVAALDAIYAQLEAFDVVVLIRGGGATSDLSSFDSYDLAAHVAQFPLPVVCGIGHQRDNTVPDMVAHTRVNTPTAAADFLVERVHFFEMEIDGLSQEIVNAADDLLADEQRQMLSLTSALTMSVQRQTAAQTQFLAEAVVRLRLGAQMIISSEKKNLEQTASVLHANRPEQVLQRGYLLARRNGKCVTSAAALNSGDELQLQFADGTKQSIIK